MSDGRNVMESIEKLRKLTICDKGEEYTAYLDAGDIADEIEREIAEKYMELPVDAEGVPLHLNDEVVSLDTNAQLVVTGIADDAVQVSCFSVWERGDHFVHVKPRTVEDVLMDYTRDVLHKFTHNDFAESPDEIEFTDIAKYASELQMRGDAE